MATTTPDNIWTPDSGDDYALTTDLAATADTVQDAISNIRTALNTTPYVKGGLLTATTDANGYITVTHGLVAPVYPTANITDGTPVAGNRLMVQVEPAEATTFRVRVYRTDDGNSFGNNAVRIVWNAVGGKPA